MGCRQCLPFSVVQLKGKHCRKAHCRNGVVDTFGQWVYKAPLCITLRIKTWVAAYLGPQVCDFIPSFYSVFLYLLEAEAFDLIRFGFTAGAAGFAHFFPFGVWTHENRGLQSASSLHALFALLSLPPGPWGLHSVIMTNKANANNNFKQADDISIWMMIEWWRVINQCRITCKTKQAYIS